MVISDCVGTLSVRVRHRSFVVGEEKLCSPEVEGIKEAFSQIFSLLVLVPALQLASC